MELQLDTVILALSNVHDLIFRKLIKKYISNRMLSYLLLFIIIYLYCLDQLFTNDNLLCNTIQNTFLNRASWTQEI